MTGLATANKFNEYFSSIATNLTNNLGAVDESVFDGLPACYSSCFMSSTNSNEIKSILMSFKNKRYHRDEIQPFILLSIFDHIGEALCHVFNLSLSTGIYPDILKHARIEPIFKSGDSSSVSNYRPISTLTDFNKLLEKIIHTRLTDFLLQKSILSINQFGFRKKVNTTMAIFYFVKDLLHTYHHKKVYGLFILRFEKSL